MSIFGDDPPDTARSKGSLFDDDSTPTKKKSALGGGNASSSGGDLFANDGDTANGSPWDFSTPSKRNSRGNPVKTLLPAGDVPEAYVDAYDNVTRREGNSSGVSHEMVARILGQSQLGDEEKSRIEGIVGQGTLGRNEFNVLVALIGLAKEGEEISLDSVDERRRKLPTVPSIDLFSESKPDSRPTTQEARPPATPTANTKSSAAARKQSFGASLESDPWGSPALPKNPNHNAPASPATNGSMSTAGTLVGGAPRTTSSFTTRSTVDDTADRPTTGGWGGEAAFGEGGLGGNEGFGGTTPGAAAGGAVPGVTAPRRSAGVQRATGSAVEEVVTINTLPEKEGMFLFQHRNYEVSSVRRNSTVVRRYSDFVWLLDCLYKRYPFRQLPLLPPKRVATADNLFLEKRRRGLARFINALVRHPVLREEQLVVMFLTVPTELAVWRKQATISVQEEFQGKPLPPTLEDSLPSTLAETFDTVRSGVRRSAELYINMCSMMERLAKRNEGLAAEYLRLSNTLHSLRETSADTYAIDANDVPLLNEGLTSTAKHLAQSQGLLEDETRGWDEGVLEDLKRQRDCLVSMRDMFDRRDKYAKDNIPQLERRIEANESKLAGIQAKPDGARKPGEAEKVEDAIVKDKQSIVDQHARGVFIKECIRDEILFFQQSQYHVSRLHQDWSQELVKYSELQADNWRALSEEVETMPLGD